jgi:GYF domain 2
MRIYVTKNGHQLGPYTVEQVNAEASAGRVTPDDLAWIEGSWSKWRPLSMVPGFVPASLTPKQRASMFPAISQPPPPLPVPPALVQPGQKNKSETPKIAIPEESNPTLKTSKAANWISFFIAVVIVIVIGNNLPLVGAIHCRPHHSGHTAYCVESDKEKELRSVYRSLQGTGSPFFGTAKTGFRTTSAPKCCVRPKPGRPTRSSCSRSGEANHSYSASLSCSQDGTISLCSPI